MTAVPMIDLQAALRLEQLLQMRRAYRVFWGVEHHREWSGFSDFCGEQLKVVNKDKVLVPFVLNGTQRKLVAMEIRARRQGRAPWFLILKSRQHGVTTLEQALAYWTMWREPHHECLTLAHLDRAMRIIFRTTARLWDHQPAHHRHGKTAAGVNWLEFDNWDGFYACGTAGGAAVARGTKLSRVHVSESAFVKSLRELHRGLVDTVARGIGAYVSESTANGREGIGEAFYDFWGTARRGESEFTPIFIPWYDDPENAMVLAVPDELGQLSDEERYVQVLADRNADAWHRPHVQLTLEQMKWWRTERRRLMADGKSADAIHQEQPADEDSAFLHSEGGYYDATLIREREQACVPPVRTEDNGRLRIWEEPQDGATYVLGADPAGGTGNDDSAVVGFNAVTGRQALSYRNSRVPPDQFGYLVLGDREMGLGWRWRGGKDAQPAFIVVERDNHGHATLTGLLKIAKYPRERVYHHKEPTQDPLAAKEAKTPGWPHSAVGHSLLQTTIGRQLRDGEPAVVDVEVLRSIKRVGHGPSGADFGGRDLAVADGLAVIGLPMAREDPGFLWFGDRMVKLP